MRVLLIGNCQVQSYASIFYDAYPDAAVGVCDLSTFAGRDADTRRIVIEEYSDADFVFSQPYHLGNGYGPELKERFGSKLTVFANLYCRALHPDLCYVGGFDHRVVGPLPLSSVIVIDSFILGLSPDACLQRFDINTFEELGLLNAWDESFTELRLRDASCDVPCAELVAELTTHHPTFFNFSHPSLMTALMYFDRVLNHVNLEINWRRSLLRPDPMAMHDINPCYDFFADYLKLSFRTPQTFKAPSSSQRIPLQTYVNLFYKAYADLDKNDLRVHSPHHLKHLNQRWTALLNTEVISS